MNGTCKTCRWWQIKEDGTGHAAQLEHILMPYDFESRKNLDLSKEPEVRECLHPELGFCERPTSRNGFAVVDGSTYMAALVTAEEFGCVKHTPMDRCTICGHRASDPITDCSDVTGVHGPLDEQGRCRPCAIGLRQLAT